ncbi:winged helix-turn-helix domain-containing protein [Candidatus Microgenomates bacterium]|nr:winged helix-turn-helix domain-containing protein [Candidatus Microgenomates bacterium]
MKKIEMIWREILEMSSKTAFFEQKLMAAKLGISTSTVFAAIKPLRAIGAVTVTGRNFRVTNLEKILLFWATHRQLTRDIIYQTRVDSPILEIEGLVPPGTVYTAYSATRRLLGTAPADYDKVYVYGDAKTVDRFPKLPGTPNLFVLKADPFLKNYGNITPVSQTMVDLWNLPDWFAADFFKALKEKFYEFTYF